jgi:hypothetical protein
MWSAIASSMNVSIKFFSPVTACEGSAQTDVEFADPKFQGDSATRSWIRCEGELRPHYEPLRRVGEGG